MTISDAFAAPPAAAADGRKPSAAPSVRARVHARMRTRGPIVHRVTAAVGGVWADLRSCWWAPASLPTVQRAWVERFPDRDRVPGNSDLLYRGWLVYNHTIGLLVPLVTVAAVGVLTPAVWIVRHPARLGLTLLLATPVIATWAT